MRKHFLLILPAFCLLLQTVRSQNSEFPNAVTAKINFIDYNALNDVSGDTEDGLRISQGFELGIFRNIAPFLNVGVPFKLGIAKLPGVADNTTTTSLDLVFHIGNMRPDAKVSPYAFGGGGYFVEDFEFETGHMQFPFGAGLNFRISKYAFINLQGEYRKATEDNRDNIQLGLGFVYLPHRGEPKAAPISDRDKDGIADNVDRCPDAPGLATMLGCPDTDRDGISDADDVCPNDPGPLETKGCPDMDGDGFADKDDECPTIAGRWNGCPDTDFDGIPDKDDKCPNEAGPASNFGCPDNKDSDGDGVPDKLDKCPTVPGTAANNGCPPDADGDGVVDAVDKCPNSPGPASNNGCPEVKPETKERLKYATRAVQFETGKAKLKNESFAVLDEIVDIMRQYPDYTLSISGHTDNVGEEKKNQRLSESRAKSCYDYLTFRGIKTERLRYAGFGEERPIADNKTADGREQNRRVEFELILE